MTALSFADAPDTVFVRLCTKCGSVGALDHFPVAHAVNRDVCGMRGKRKRGRQSARCGGKKLWLVYSKTRLANMTGVGH